ncbi:MULTISPECIES: NAD(P)/FAD-dependent oxidoreductase [unclassified Rhizobium]|uniref:FAD/NAD(P)-dependent oxidoreductase n=1 Tax=unclassified Rhizobium TaxID=2613769 RepID=UPI00160F35BB|nr:MULTISPECIES: NAD(P)/FAD-dependent oxidoreductase [unclassified Rhizobium]MBB3320440.1 NADPH-dependent 2,4-dienoyl-CoA reductase/sulfur reductase-like enzyme [Rhizobium sp. BK181]MCS3743605.1 NADPH-dependent 2,4-dienoyl-CoA reductase/sulfur reductase-like enzyme [Rhizobium sp. BK661]MCS4096187.1 NADPH-dependent 2,4-dienoyl-CoA reductase/sulfur reductase-like enzyme [Rhizobium sp. BK176]
MTAPIVIIGAGPAGIAAAGVLVEAGVKPVLIDEAPEFGGQVFRQPQPELMRPTRQLYGFDTARALANFNAVASLRSDIDYRPNTQIWGAAVGMLHVVNAGRASVQPWSSLVIASGAMDRLFPVKGWTAPGVYSLGGAQVALKADASLVGRRVLFAGTGPLLYLVAYQYALAGACVVAVLETGRPHRAWRHVPALASGKAIFVRGLYYMAALRARGVAIHQGAEPIEVICGADEKVAALVFRHRRRERILACDALAIGHGLKAESQIADLLGAEFDFDTGQRQWLPRADLDGRSTISNVYLAGDGMSVRGSGLAELTGRIAASALLVDAGYGAHARLRRDRRLVERSARFRRALDKVFAYPHAKASEIPDEVTVCRCEELTAGTIRQAVLASGETEINRIKAFCRVGMGRCQGRICGQATAELIAATGGVPIESVGRIRAQAPIKPVPLCELAKGLS